MGIEFGGLFSLSQILLNSASPEKLKVKALTLVTDLITEQQSILGNPGVHERAKVALYNQLDFKHHLMEQKWCELVSKLLESSSRDTQEKVMQAMTALVSSCKKDFSAQSFSTLLKLRDDYLHLSEIEQMSHDEDVFFQTLLESANYLMQE